MGEFTRKGERQNVFICIFYLEKWAFAGILNGREREGDGDSNRDNNRKK